MTEFSFLQRPPDLPALVVGAAGLDMVGLVDAPAEMGSTIPANIRVSFGGVARNVAENLARLGQPVRLITAVGQDQSGKQLLAYTAGCGVDVHSCLHSAEYRTGSYLAVLDQVGTRYLALHDMSILAEIDEPFLRAHQADIAGASVVFLDANLAEESMSALISMANQAGVPVVADTTSLRLASRLAPHLEHITAVTANSAEATELCAQNPVVRDHDSALLAARQLVNRGVELAVVPLAEFGVAYATSETSGHVPAVRTSVLDPTGAGDALTATVIFGLLNDIPIDESVRLGVTAASLILRHRGTVLPGLSLEKLYDELVV